MKTTMSILATLAFVMTACGSGSDDPLLKACSPRSTEGAGCNNPAFEIKNSNAYNNGSIILFGDSIASGEGASSDLKSLVGCMALSLSAGKTVSSYASSGATTVDSMNKLNLAVSDKAALAVISLGGNDVLVDTFNKSIPEATTLGNIRTIFRSFTDAGTLVLHIGLNPPPNPNIPFKIDTSRLAKIKDIAIEEGVIFLENSLEGMWGNAKYMADEVHPNDKGYALLCDRVKAKLAPHFKL